MQQEFAWTAWKINKPIRLGLSFWQRQIFACYRLFSAAEDHAQTFNAQ